MKINAIHSIRNGNKINSSNVAFERKLKDYEKADYSNTINQAMNYLGIVNRAMVIHAPSFPASQKTDIDQGIGVPYGEGTHEFINFLKLHGFNSVQLGPMGKLNRGDTAPYTSSVFAKNPLFIDAKALTTAEYGKILSDEELEGNTYEALNSEKNYRRVDYKDAQETIDTLMSIAYNNFQTKLSKRNKDAQNLNKQFEAFKNENSEWLEKYSVLDIIAQRHNTDFYPNWPKEDRELLAKVKKGDLAAKRTYNQIKKDNAAQIDKYQFTQFIIDKQGKESVQKTLAATNDMSEKIDAVTSTVNDNITMIHGTLDTLNRINDDMQGIKIATNEVDKAMSVCSENAEQLIVMTEGIRVDAEATTDYAGKIIEIDDELSTVVDGMFETVKESGNIMTNDEFAVVIEKARKAHGDWIDNIVGMVEEMKTVPLQYNPTKCAFGHFYRAIPLENGEIANTWNRIDKVHKDFHTTGAEIKKAVKAGDEDTARKYLEKAQALSEDMFKCLDEVDEYIANKATKGENIF